MKKAALIASCLLGACITAFAQYPDVYLRGDFNNTSWNVNEAYKFTNEGNLYTLQITSANPIKAGDQFKIADKEWDSVDLGGYERGTSIDYTQNIELKRSGQNLTTNIDITEATISFTYSPDMSKAAL